MRSVAVGLPYADNNPNLTFIFFIALTLLAVLGLRFSYYAYRNRQTGALGTGERLWETLVLAGLFAVGFALLGLVELLTVYVLPFKMALLLAAVFVLSVSLRVLYRSVVPVTAGDAADPERELTRGAVVGVSVVFAGLALVGRHPLVLAVTGASALGFALAGGHYGRRGAAEARVQGTVADTLLRHLLPVLLFAALVPALELAVLVGLDRIVVLHVQVVFVIMTATTLMTATIKLRQNLAGL
ncbi:hypothetical protein [Haloarcula onubensis]|uniref:Uncharacterized protein n=1 Tax=Haloarcula onubensis TaxID=2950539 RepID=A0ABU2FL74_9EURY|nr:hypothetical protein [Halomicroarcula sp. S3CR25-11]MDS0281480.1 hypothetical protein [Halomicroarcula sp. S3CR25-11]